MVTSFGIPMVDMKKAMAGAAAAFSIGSAVLPPAAMAESRLIGEIAGSGLVFKDTLQVESFDDPKVCKYLYVLVESSMIGRGVASIAP